MSPPNEQQFPLRQCLWKHEMLLCNGVSHIHASAGGSDPVRDNNNNRSRYRMSSEEASPAAVPEPVEDVHGDGRWMSQVGRGGHGCTLLQPVTPVNPQLL